MPKNKQYAGMRQPSHVLNSAGSWVKSKFAGMRTRKNTRLSDLHWLKLGRKKTTHTSPIARTVHNDGHNNPTRMRNARTKRIHTAKRQGIPTNGSIPCPDVG